ncbi:C39 family peptidase [Massilia endophytica]|uniref:C39 family peptidase n=1 Tax=Massilia endophytica TaxID=2899220 RepID=UPI001E30269D|nr:C39 family peptidase [Massilia endophytica]UGQ48266.1 C39 family peptidase [Massilia endophytica]
MRAAILSCCLALGGAAQSAELPNVTGAAYAVPVTSLKEARYLSTVRQQYDFSCGSAAVATLLTYHYNYPVSEQTAFQQMYLHGDQAKIRQQGFSLLDIKRFLAAHGFMADGFQLPLAKLAEAHYPAIVLVAENGYRHFVVIKGLSEDRVLIGDPSGGTRAIARSAFEAMWQNRLLFVIHGRPGAARFNEAADWRVAPRARVEDAIDRESLWRLTLPKLGPNDF